MTDLEQEKQEIKKELILDNLLQQVDLFLERSRTEKLEGKYLGTIVDNRDPDKFGKCRVRVLGVFDDEIPDDELPWAIPEVSPGDSASSFKVPTINSKVGIYFDRGNIYSPIYTLKPLIINDGAGGGGGSEAGNTPSGMPFGGAAAAARSIAALLENYPETEVQYETNSGTYITYNRATDLYTFRHMSGTIITIDKQGNLSINSDASGGNISIKSGKNLNLEAASNINIKAGSKITVGCQNMESSGMKSKETWTSKEFAAATFKQAGASTFSGAVTISGALGIGGPMTAPGIGAGGGKSDLALEINKLKQIYNSHTHIYCYGPVTPPLAPML